jgi:hypothetical protein
MKISEEKKCNLLMQKIKYIICIIQVNADFLLNFSIYGLIFAPIVLMTSRFFLKTGSGVPVMNK